MVVWKRGSVEAWWAGMAGTSNGTCRGTTGSSGAASGQSAQYQLLVRPFVWSAGSAASHSRSLQSFQALSPIFPAAPLTPSVFAVLVARVLVPLPLGPDRGRGGRLNN